MGAACQSTSVDLGKCQTTAATRWVKGITGTFLGSSYLEIVNGEFYIDSNQNLLSVSFIRLDRVMGHLWVGSNPVLQSVGLDLITEINGDLKFHNNPMLNNMYLPKLTTVMGVVKICIYKAGSALPPCVTAKTCGTEIQPC
jgi:hypothetical protein